MAQKLTDAIIRKEPAPDKGSKPLYDTDVKGFGCRIYAPTKRNPDGSRSFFLNYHVDGIERRFTIGEVLCEGIELCEPCRHLQSLTDPGVLRGLVHRGGLRAAVLHSGTISVGHAVRPS